MTKKIVQAKQATALTARWHCVPVVSFTFLTALA